MNQRQTISDSSRVPLESSESSITMTEFEGF
jgi:hypothetical protein